MKKLANAKKKRHTNFKKKKLKRQARLRLAKWVSFRKPDCKQRVNRFTIDYKNLPLLRRFISFEGKIIPRRVSRLTAKKQRKMAKAVKTARVASLLPFIRQQ